jgi:hypothetical protein
MHLSSKMAHENDDSYANINIGHDKMKVIALNYNNNK